MTKLFKALGLMSGTSMDGIDVAMITTDGEQILEFGAHMAFPYENRGEVKELAAQALNGGARDMAAAENSITELHINVVREFLAEQNLQPSDVDVIGFHGQTILHEPGKGITIQLGNGSLMAHATGINTVYDFRRADVASGGQGAPLVPVYHLALARLVASCQLPVASDDGADRRHMVSGFLPLVFLNLGGVGNLTYIESDNPEDMIAFDTGPGNALLDDWVKAKTGRDYDESGRIANSGKVYINIVEEFLADPFFARSVPKSLDRNHFNMKLLDNLSPEDGAATLAEFTAASVLKGCDHLPENPSIWLVCGGGRKNTSIMNALKEKLGNVKTVEEVGLNGDAIEAQAFAYLAVRSIRRLPVTYPGTTGVRSAATGGAFCQAAPCA